MLEELRIRNFAIIDSLELTFAGGLNVITGETGAGKSIIIDAVELLLGGKTDAGVIRSSADRATVEGVFALKGVTRALLIPVLQREDLLEDDQIVTLYREVRSNGRTLARINGITVNLEVLKEIGDLLIDIHGQSEHMSLFNPKHHLDLLDRYADLLEIREALSTLVGTLGDVRTEIKSLVEDAAALQRHADQLKREIEEIDAAQLKPGEEDELRAERKRLSNSEQLAQLATAIVTLLSGSDTASDELPGIDRLMQVAAHMSKLAAIDPDLEEWSEVAESISAQAQELAIEMADYIDSVEYDPRRIDQIEERLEAISRLKRRYGLTVEAVLDHADNARAALDRIEHSEERLNELRAKETALLQHIGEMAANVSEVRQRTGRQLARRVMNELKDLRMERALFEVHINHDDDPEGCYVGERRLAFDANGIDRVEFMLTANPGEPLRPLVKVASGGEAARIMLGLKRVLAQADHTPTLIFDEVDQGIGGRIGTVVGEKLWSLTNGHQVMVVTHLPQLAGYADQHYHVVKRSSQTSTATQVVVLDSDEARVQELSEMLGASGEGSMQSAREILAEARTYKGLQAHPHTPNQTPNQGKLL
ncbi:MAG TPA: DNA repair protein RecN [Aggregatilineales bacterium]|nr:DNA repair protein RecN [Aggregatilineales bacterium]